MIYFNIKQIYWHRYKLSKYFMLNFYNFNIIYLKYVLYTDNHCII